MTEYILQDNTLEIENKELFEGIERSILAIAESKKEIQAIAESKMKKRELWLEKLPKIDESLQIAKHLLKIFEGKDPATFDRNEKDNFNVLKESVTKLESDIRVINGKIEELTNAPGVYETLYEKAIEEDGRLTELKSKK